jgi:hypothetical protein
VYNLNRTKQEKFPTLVGMTNLKTPNNWRFEMFTQQNTDGYTDQELDALNAELVERLADLDPGSDDYQQAEKEFHDEVSRR